jgi:hypothetical protein
MPNTPTPYAEQIKADYLSGSTKLAISQRYGVNYSTVRHYTAGMGRNKPYSDSRRRMALMRVGKGGLVSGLNDDQLSKLDAFARKIGCDTLIEAALEILRDELEEM